MTRRIAKRWAKAAGIARLRGDARGASVVEFALVSPILAMMIMGIADVGRGFAERFALEQATQRTIEMASVGAVGSDYSYLRNYGRDFAGVPIAQVTLDQWSECWAPNATSGTRMPNFDDTCNSGEQVARYVEVAIWRGYRPFFTYGPLGRYAGLQSDGTLRLNSRAAVRVQ